MNNEIRSWLEAHKNEITHFRPRRWCGAEMLLPYNRRLPIPLIEGAPMIYDTKESADLILEVLGPGYIEERFAGMEGSRNY